MVNCVKCCPRGYMQMADVFSHSYIRNACQRCTLEQLQKAEAENERLSAVKDEFKNQLGQLLEAHKCLNESRLDEIATLKAKVEEAREEGYNEGWKYGSMGEDL